MRQEHMALNLYRRHRLECEGGHPEDSHSGDWDERRKGWKRCNCVIHISGTLGGRFKRRATGRTTWEEARAVATALELANAWDPTVSPLLPAPVLGSTAPPSEASQVTITRSIEMFLANREASVSFPTYRKYKTFTKQLQVFADSLGYVMLAQFRPGDIDRFYTGSTLGPRSKLKMLDRLRSFFKFAVNREWISKSPVSSDLKPPARSSRAANKVPFTDEQLADLIKVCDHVEDRRWGNRHGSGKWTGEDLKDFIWLSVYTGLRISDVVLFDMERVDGNEVYLRAKKNGGDVFTYIPDWLRDRLLKRAEKFGQQPFMIGGSNRLDTVIDLWRQQLARVFELADVGKERPTPHRFRHTFARILLEKGVPVADVADLLGDDEKTARDHYARWVPERQARLTKILKHAFRHGTKTHSAPRRRAR
jgi:integrase